MTAKIRENRITLVDKCNEYVYFTVTAPRLMQ